MDSYFFLSYSIDYQTLNISRYILYIGICSEKKKYKNLLATILFRSGFSSSLVTVFSSSTLLTLFGRISPFTSFDFSNPSTDLMLEFRSFTIDTYSIRFFLNVMSCLLNQYCCIYCFHYQNSPRSRKYTSCYVLKELYLFKIEAHL